MVLMAGAGSAWAYPTAVIFSPSGKSLPAYNVNAYLYGGLAVPTSRFEVNPWAGLQWGLFPAPARDASRPRFGGMEVGLDVLGTGSGPNKLVLNAKVQLLAAWGKAGPDLSVGLMQFALGDFSRSMNFGYVVASRAFCVGGRSIGELAVGWGHSFAPSPPSGQSRAFEGTFPFRPSAREAVLLGYTTPSFGPFSAAIDHFGGTSEASDLYAGLNVAACSWLLVTPGAYLSLARGRQTADGVFLNVAMAIDYAQRAPSKGSGGGAAGRLAARWGR